MDSELGRKLYRSTGAPLISDNADREQIAALQ